MLSVPFLTVSFPWKSFFLVTAPSALLLLVRGLRGRSLYSALFEWWPMPALFVLSCYLAPKKRWVDPNYFTVLILISAFQKGVFYKGCLCCICQNFFSLLHLNLFLLHTQAQKLTFREWFVDNCKGMLCLIAFQLSAVTRSFNVLPALDQNLALRIDF